MILPKFILESRQNKVWTESGIDSIEHCLDKNHFKNYPHQIIYDYNSRGFRDAEWPIDVVELQNAIWCFGDSFTTGLGSPLHHTWVNILQSKIGNRCINVSLDGASNQWIARKVIEVLTTIKPALLVIQWSYTSRDEVNNDGWSDENRRLGVPAGELILNNVQLLLKLQDLIQQVESHKQDTRVIHSYIPDFSDMLTEYIVAMKLWNNVKGDSWPAFPTSLTEFINIPMHVIDELNMQYTDLLEYVDYCKQGSKLGLPGLSIPEIKHLDIARDGHHYGIITATDFVEKLVSLAAPLRCR